MTVDEARMWLASLASGERRYDGIAHAAYVDQYAEGSEPTRARLLEAMTLLLVDGDESDQLFATGFFGAVGAPPEVLEQLVATYLARGLDGRHPVATVLGRSTFHLPAEAAADLRRQFVADPIRHFGLAHAVLVHDRGGPAWDGFVRALRHIDQPDDLVGAFRAAFAAERENDFYSLMRTKPEALVRAVAQRLIPASRGALLAAAGLE
jgi:hypothetical protein